MCVFVVSVLVISVVLIEALVKMMLLLSVVGEISIRLSLCISRVVRHVKKTLVLKQTREDFFKMYYNKTLDVSST